MESIIIFVLFIVVSTVFQVIKEAGKKQAAPPAAKPSKPVSRPAVAPHRSPGYQSPGHMSSKPRPQPMYSAPVPSEISQAPMEGIQTEAKEYSTPIEQRQETPASAPTSMFQGIQYDDLQRSIIMTEILGKPKALRKN